MSTNTQNFFENLDTNQEELNCHPGEYNKNYIEPSLGPVQYFHCPFGWYDFALVEDLYVGDPMPSAVPVAFIDNEDNEYLKGSHFLTARLNNFRFNGIPLLWAIPLVVLYGLFKLITGRNEDNYSVENNNSIHYTDIDPFAKPEEE